jgi:hypothetical protein
MPYCARRRQFQVDHPGVDGAARHPVEARAARVLRDDQAAGLVDLADAARAVAAGAGQDHRDGAATGVLGQRAQEVIDRQGQPAGRVLVGQQQVAAGQDHVLARRDEVDVVRLDRDAVGHLLDRDAGPPRQQLDHPALEVGGQVLQHDEGHSAGLRHGREQRLERLQAARRRADADDRQRGLCLASVPGLALAARFRIDGRHIKGILVAVTRGATDYLNWIEIGCAPGTFDALRSRT